MATTDLVKPRVSTEQALQTLIEALAQLKDSLSAEAVQTIEIDLLSAQSFEHAKRNLIKAQETYRQALNEAEMSRSTLENKRAELLVEGVEGKNAEARDAVIRQTLRLDYAQLSEREMRLNEARAALEIARLEWDHLRYQLRLLGVASSLERDSY